MRMNGSFARFGLDQLQDMIKQRRHQIDKLLKRRKRVELKLDVLDRQIEKLSGSRPSATNGSTRTSRRRNESSLPATLEQVLSTADKPMSIGDIMDRVLATGYRSNSTNFRTVVSIALSKDSRFENVNRGIYQLAGSQRKPGRKAKGSATPA